MSDRQFNWSGQQLAALRKIDGFTEGVILIFGFAGSGKSTLIQYLAANDPRLRVAAYSGKAADVLRRKGVASASTIHRMIYKSPEHSRAELDRLKALLKETPNNRRIENRIQEEQEYLRNPKWELNVNAFDAFRPSRIIIDECSMVDFKLARDLLSFRIPLLVFGDPMQLPPIRGSDAGYFMQQHPAVMLTEIHRQARDNPIIKMATIVREGGYLSKKPGAYGDCEITGGKPDGWWEDFDQVIVGKLTTKHRLNMQARRGLGFSNPYPEVGERLICLQNNHEAGLLNGSQWEVLEADADSSDDFLDLLVRNDDGREVSCQAWKAVFTDGEEQFKEDMPYYPDRCEAEMFDFGYAITAHKAQGSEWDRVLVIDESRCWKRKEMDTSRNWLYTAISRAVKHVTIVR